jgi:hypothetical protein
LKASVKVIFLVISDATSQAGTVSEPGNRLCMMATVVGTEHSGIQIPANLIAMNECESNIKLT